jgi:hypothetical protein
MASPRDESGTFPQRPHGSAAPEHAPTLHAGGPRQSGPAAGIPTWLIDSEDAEPKRLTAEDRRLE